MKCIDINQFIKEITSNKFQYFLLVIPSEYERKKLIERIIKHFSKNKEYSINNFSASEDVIEKVLESFNTPSLFGGEAFTVIDDLQQYRKKDLEKLSTFLKKQNLQGNVLFGSKEKKSILSIFHIIEQRGVVLDLSSEKFWEKEKRLKIYFIEKCRKNGKNITLDTMNKLFDRVGFEMDEIDNEIEKLITFVGDKDTIDIGDIKKICINSSHNTTWQLAEKIVWKEPLKERIEDVILDTTFFHGFIIALRYQLQLGLKLASFALSNLRIEDHLSYFPRVSISSLEKKQNVAKTRGVTFFKKALIELFKIDLLSKNQTYCLPALIDFLRGRLEFLLYYEKVDKTSTNTSSESIRS